MPLTEFCDRYDKQLPRTPDTGSLSPGRTVRLESDPRRGTITAGKKGDDYLDKMGRDTIAGAPCEVRYVFYSVTEDQFAAARAPLDSWTWRNWTEYERPRAAAVTLGAIELTLDHAYFASVVAAISERYGAPITATEENLQNRFGATFNAVQLHWVIGEDAIIARERVNTIDRTKISFVRVSVTGRASVFHSASRADAKDDM